MCVLTLHASTDAVYIQASGYSPLHIPYQDLERKLPQAIVSYTKDKNVDTLCTINGPGSFTILRIACLCANMFCDASVIQNLKHIDIPKLDIYTSLVDQGVLPSVGVIFIGQRKKMRLMNRKDMHEETKDIYAQRDITLINNETVLDTLGEDEYWIDQVSSHPVVDVLDQDRMVYIGQYDPDTGVECVYKGDILHTGPLGKSVEGSIYPRYIIEPTIG